MESMAWANHAGTGGAARISLLGLLMLLMLGWASSPAVALGAPPPATTPQPVLEPVSPQNAARLEQVAFLPYPGQAQASALAFGLADGAVLAVGFADGTLRLWDAASAELLGEVGAHEGRTAALAFSPRDRDLLASASFDTSTRLWFVSRRGLVASDVLDDNDEYTVESLAFTPSGLNLVAGYGDNRFIGWRVADGVAAASRQVGETGFAVLDAAVSRQGDLLALGSADGFLSLWAVDERDGFRAYFRWSRGLSPSSPVTTVAFSPENDRLLAFGSHSGQVRIWDAPTRQEQAAFMLTGSVVEVGFSPDGSLLFACTDDGQLHLWEVYRWQEVVQRIYRPLAGGCAFSPDGLRIGVLLETGVSLLGVRVPEPTATASASPTRPRPLEGSVTPSATPTWTPAPPPPASPAEGAGSDAAWYQVVGEEALKAFGQNLGTLLSAGLLLVLLALVYWFLARRGKGGRRQGERLVRLLAHAWKGEIEQAWRVLRGEDEQPPPDP